MPITLVTGQPRAGKTLWTICRVKARAEKENRQVFTCNIPNITIPGWQTFDHPDKWLDCPPGALIIIDEVQDFDDWQRKPAGSPPTKPILELSKHGKRGFDIYFITQQPNLIHSTPRDLTAEHYYIVRAFGSHNAMVYKFMNYELHPNKSINKAVEKVPFRYPKEAFNWYKSADVHNIKRKIPLRLIALPVGALLIPIFGYVGFKFFMGSIKGKADQVSSVFGGGKADASKTPGARPPSLG